LSLGIFAIEATTAIGVDGTGQPSDERQLGFLGHDLLVALSVVRPDGPLGSRRRYTTDHREPEQPGPSINLVHIPHLFRDHPSGGHLTIAKRRFKSQKRASIDIQLLFGVERIRILRAKV
jgi:hypothetical protein